MLKAASYGRRSANLQAAAQESGRDQLELKDRIGTYQEAKEAMNKKREVHRQRVHNLETLLEKDSEDRRKAGERATHRHTVTTGAGDGAEERPSPPMVVPVA